MGIAYALKEALRDFYNVWNARHAGYFLKYIYMYCLKSENEDIVSLGKMLENHYDGIVMWHTHKSSNGYAEGTNSVIQAVKRRARGYRDWRNLRTICYLRGSGLC